MVDQVLYDSTYAPPAKRAPRGIDLDLIYGMAYRPRILIVDDDIDTVVLLKEMLSVAGFDVIGALSCSEAIKKCVDFPPQMILLDLMMPDVDGWETFNSLRNVTAAPVIIVSARNAKDDVVRGLRSGADDYIAKPFFNAELVERVKSVLRRVKAPEMTNHYSFPQVELAIDLEDQTVMLRNEPVRLTGREFALLVLLAKQAPKTVSLKNIGLEIWGEDTPETHSRIKYLVYLLRKKVEKEPKHPSLILKGEISGYCLNIRSS